MVEDGASSFSLWEQRLLTLIRDHVAAGGIVLEDGSDLVFLWPDEPQPPLR